MLRFYDCTFDKRCFTFQSSFFFTLHRLWNIFEWGLSWLDARACISLTCSCLFFYTNFIINWSSNLSVNCVWYALKQISDSMHIWTWAAIDARCPKLDENLKSVDVWRWASDFFFFRINEENVHPKWLVFFFKETYRFWWNFGYFSDKHSKIES